MEVPRPDDVPSEQRGDIHFAAVPQPEMEIVRTDATGFEGGAPDVPPLIVASEGRRGRLAWEDINPEATHHYPLVRSARDEERAVIVPSDSALANGRLQFISHGYDASVPEARIGYPGRMQIIDTRLGSRCIRGEATHFELERWREVDVPQAESTILTADDIIVRSPPILPPERELHHPPDEIRIDELPEDDTQVRDAIAALIDGYVTDAVHRLTSDYPALPGSRWFRPGVAALGIKGGPILEQRLRQDLLGVSPLGLTRIVLNDDKTNRAVARGRESPYTATVAYVLQRFGCGVVDIQALAAARNTQPSAAAIRFGRRADIVIGSP